MSDIIKAYKNGCVLPEKMVVFYQNYSRDYTSQREIIGIRGFIFNQLNTTTRVNAERISRRNKYSWVTFLQFPTAVEGKTKNHSDL